LELAGPAELSFDELVSAYRMWLGEKPARLIEVPRWMMSAIYRAGDLAGWLGWRPPIRSNARFEIMRGASGDPGPWMRLTKIVPRALVETLRREPCTVQERWFARLYLLKPVIFLVLAAFWAGTALMALGPGWSIGLSLMYEGGTHAPWAAGVVVAGALADLAIGIGIAFRRTARPALWAGIIISLVYAVIGSWMVPRLWVDPLGPMLKIWPVLLLNVVALAIIDDR